MFAVFLKPSSLYISVFTHWSLKKRTFREGVAVLRRSPRRGAMTQPSNSTNTSHQRVTRRPPVCRTRIYHVNISHTFTTSTGVIAALGLPRRPRQVAQGLVSRSSGHRTVPWLPGLQKPAPAFGKSRRWHPVWAPQACAKVKQLRRDHG